VESTMNVWTYRDTTLKTDLNTANVVGYDVVALDGSIGKVDEATFDAASGYIVVDTGPWIFGKKVLLPAGVIQSADHSDEKVFVNRTKDQIKNAPEFDDSLTRDDVRARGSSGRPYPPRPTSFGTRSRLTLSLPASARSSSRGTWARPWR
jgi:PRC-barrel domain